MRPLLVSVVGIWASLAVWAGAKPVTASGLPPLPWGPDPPAAAARDRAAAIAGLGRTLFFDPALSASGHMACATCHDPAHGFSAPDAQPVRLGGPDGRLPGVRAVPGLMYLQTLPPFTEHFFQSDEEGDGSADQGPTGGLDWDGRVDRARDQAALPLLDKNEMANASPAAVVAAVASAGYAGTVRQVFGQDIFADPARAFAALTGALELYQQTQAVFSPFSSKYDAFLASRAALTPPQARGLAIFNDPRRGNCASCHRSTIAADGSPPLFTDFGYAALGVPRNRAIPANNDPAYADLGLCGALRTGLVRRTDYCGMFKTPTLRNVALKQSFYHNGVFHTLRDAVAFYATRDTDPARWYQGRRFDDLPPAYHRNVTIEVPFGDRRVLSDTDVDDLVTFLRTLTDGYQP